MTDIAIYEGTGWLPHDISKALVSKRRGRSILGSKEWLELMDIRQAYLHLAMFKADMVFGPPSIWSHYDNLEDS